MASPHVVVIGGGLAGLAASLSLSDHGALVSLIEKDRRLGGRATSYLLPSGEYVDNCQHVTLRCCTNLADFFKRLGVADKIKYYDRLAFADSKGNRGEIKASALPAPFHLLPAFARFPLLNWKDKLAIARAMLRIVRSRGLSNSPAGTTMLQWLQHNRQTANAIDRFWRVVLVSALNEQLDRTDASYGIDVFWKAFLCNPDAFGMGVPSTPLETLYASAGDRIERNGGQVRTRCGASELCIANGAMEAVRLDDGTLLKGDYYIAAAPFDRFLKMLPAEFRQKDDFANIAKLKVSPITSVHIWFDRQVMAEPFVASVDQTIQWVFNKSSLSTSSGQYLQAVISASYALASRSQQDVIAMCRKEVEELLPVARQAEVVRAVVIRVPAATFAPEPDSDRWRPVERTAVRNLYMAGDWTRTGWPATMESAVRSGYRAAEAILESEGKQVQLVLPELPASGLAKFFAGKAPVSSQGKS